MAASAFMPRLRSRCRGSRAAGRPATATRPDAGVGETARAALLDEEGVLGLAAAGDARVPGERVPRLDRLP